MAEEPPEPGGVLEPGAESEENILHEKGGKEHQVSAHHRLVEYLGE